MIKVLANLQKDPIFLDDKILKILSFMRSFDFKNAKDLILEVIFYKPFEINFWEKLSTCYMHLKDYKNALISFNTLLFLDPNNENNYINLAKCYLSLNDKKLSFFHLNEAKKLTNNVNTLNLIDILIKQNNLS
jgi:tetratricopeptide (TPR) repeat protein